jgi:redox-sensitive bicupin YhaK (pirin superfamily)
MSAILEQLPLGLPWPAADPFLFCVHHDDAYPAGNEHMGPAASLAGRDIGQDFAGKDGWRMYHGEIVPGFPQHPHRGFETVTIMLEGRMRHRDSVGNVGLLEPGSVQWMTAGRGIVHSERSSEEARRAGPSLHGIQCWVALPQEQEEIDPTFHHHPADSLPSFNQGAARVRLVAGTAYGSASPVAVLSPLFFAEATLPAGGTLPLPDEHPERAVYVVEGTIASRGGDHAPGQMAVFRAGARAVVTAQTNARLILLGGAPIGERHIWWNFVSSSRERLERAALDWKEGRFPKVPGDEQEFIPLPDRPIPPGA